MHLWYTEQIKMIPKADVCTLSHKNTINFAFTLQQQKACFNLLNTALLKYDSEAHITFRYPREEW